MQVLVVVDEVGAEEAEEFGGAVVAAAGGASSSNWTWPVRRRVSAVVARRTGNFGERLMPRRVQVPIRSAVSATNFLRRV